VRGEGGPPGAVDVPGQPGHAAEHLERTHVEVGSLTAPCGHQAVDLVLHGTSYVGLVLEIIDAKSLDIKNLALQSCLDIKILER
jgi:hypothetical protein